MTYTLNKNQNKNLYIFVHKRKFSSILTSNDVILKVYDSETPDIVNDTPIMEKSVSLIDKDTHIGVVLNIQGSETQNLTSANYYAILVDLTKDPVEEVSRLEINLQ